MGLMTKTQFVSIVEAMSSIFASVRSANTTMNADLLLLANANPFFPIINDAETPNADVIIPYVDQANRLDLLMTTGYDSALLLRSIAPLRAFITCFQSHLKRIPLDTLADRTLDGFLIQQGIDEDATLVKVNDIWLTLSGVYVQARTVPMTTVVTMLTAAYTLATNTWVYTEGTNLFAGLFYNPKMASKWENFAPSPLTVTKNGTESLTVDISVTGLNENGETATVAFTDVVLAGTAATALDTSKLFVAVSEVVITGDITVNTTFTFKNVLP